jgi:hypothetical protein
MLGPVAAQTAPRCPLCRTPHGYTMQYQRAAARRDLIASFVVGQLALALLLWIWHAVSLFAAGT